MSKPKPSKKVEKKCTCVYKQGKRIGMCLRCFELELAAFNRGRKQTIKLMMKAYKERGKPYWFINITDVKNLKENIDL